VRSTFIGDLVIGFGSGRPSGGRGCAGPWTTALSGLGWEASQQAPGPNWKGFPLTEFKTPRWTIWLLGELVGGSDGKPEGGALLIEVVRGGRTAAELNGHFLLWAWDENDQKWHVWTDRFGTLHAYHACSGSSAALGSSFEAVASLASRKQLDWQALTGFLGFGFFPADRTYYEDVRILRPATHYIFNASGREVSAERYYNWHHDPDYRRSYEDTVEQFGGIFQSAMADRLALPSAPQTSAPGLLASRAVRIAIPISGGLDSRSTVAAINPPLHSGMGSPLASQSASIDHLWSYSYGYAQDSVEIRIAREVAQVRGVPFQAFTLNNYLFDRLGEVLAAIEGFQDSTQCRQAFIAGELREHADFVIAAHWGDVWLDQMGLVNVEGAGRGARGGGLTPGFVSEHAQKKMLKRGRGWLLENVCTPHLGGEKPEALLRRFVDQGMEPLQTIEDPDFRVKAFKTDNWSFRWTSASLRMFQAAAFPRLPFYDTRLAEFFSTVPSEYVSGRRLQIDYLKRFAPDLARVDWQPYNSNLYDYRAPDAWGLPKRAWNKAWRALKRKKVIERNWEVQFNGEKGKAGLDHWLLRPGLRLHDLVAKSKTEQLLNDFRMNPLGEGRGYTVSMLLTLSAWLER